MGVIEAAVPRLKMDLYPASVREPKEFESAFSSLAGKRAEALVVYPDGMFVIQLRPKDSGIWNDWCFGAPWPKSRKKPWQIAMCT